MVMDERERMNQSEFLMAAIDAARLCVFELDLESMRYTRFANPEALLGKSEEEIFADLKQYDGLSWQEHRAAMHDYFYDTADHNAVGKGIREVLENGRGSFYARIKTTKGRVWCKIDAVLRTDNGEPRTIVGVASNVDRLMRMSEEYREKAERDSLTQLLNKRSTENNISAIIESNPRRRHALILLDLDNFKQINDHYGHREGDNVLRSCAEHIQGLFRRTDVVGRWGGDEFVVFMTDVPNEEILRRKLEQMLQGGNYMGVTKSLGVSLFPQHGLEIDVLFQKADRALYNAKRTKCAYAIYEEE